MAGHSKWANIKHHKARMDAKRSKIWSKCSKALMAAARAGGPDPSFVEADVLDRWCCVLCRAASGCYGFDCEAHGVRQVLEANWLN